MSDHEVSSEEPSHDDRRPGDRARIPPREFRRLSRIGVHRRPLGFTQEHLDELRREMGEGLGEDLSR